jgi:6-phospho-beta-glucosidase
VIDSNGAKPLAVGSVPEEVRSLLLQVKRYEQLTAQAALEGSARIAQQALAANPLVGNSSLADAMGDEYLHAHKPYLDYLQ